MRLARAKKRGSVKMTCIMVVPVHDMIAFRIENCRSDEVEVETRPYERLETLSDLREKRRCGSRFGMFRRHYHRPIA